VGYDFASIKKIQALRILNEDPTEDGTRFDVGLWARVWGDFRSMVRDYNKQKLSVETDKLPAIAALAETYASHIRGDYLAGLIQTIIGAIST